MGGNLTGREITDLGKEVGACLTYLFDEVPAEFLEAAKEKWIEAYPKLTEERSGMLGAVTARGPAQVLRIALVYAILDKKTIKVEHIEAVLAVWRYAEASARNIFGDMIGDRSPTRSSWH